MPVSPDPSGDFRGWQKVGADGHCVAFEPILCDADEQAIERAKLLLGERDIEVWCADRMVAKLTGNHPGAVTLEIKDGCLKPKN